MPREVAGCFTKAGDYGRYLISSGPYMIAGSDKLDAASCAAVKASGPISGFDGERSLDLVRNPAYDARATARKARENLPDEFTFTVNSNTDDIYARVARGVDRGRGRAGAADGPAPATRARRSCTRTRATSRATSR